MPDGKCPCCGVTGLSGSSEAFCDTCNTDSGPCCQGIPQDPMSDLWDTLKEALGERLIDLFFKERYDTSYGDTFKYTLIVAEGKNDTD